MKEEKQLTNDNSRYKIYSIFGKVIILIIIMAVLQAGICFGALRISGTLRAVKNQIYDAFYSSVLKRAENVQDTFEDKSRSVEFYKDEMEARIEEILTDKNKKTEELKTDVQLNEEVIIEVADEIESLLRNSGGSGAFVVLDGYGDDSAWYCGYYLRNLDLKSETQEQYTVLRGSDKVVNAVGVKKDDNWRSDFRIDQDADNDYYNCIRESMESDEEDENLLTGYWSPVFTMNGDEQNVITYTVPLVDAKGNFYGVLGVELNEQLILEELPYKEIDSNGTASYYVVYRESDSSRYKTQVASSNSGKDITDKEGFITYTEEEDYAHIYHMNENLNHDYVGTSADMQLYDGQNQEALGQWAVIGIQDEERLLSSYYSILLAIIGIVVLVIFIEGLGICYMAYKLSTHIRKMTFTIVSASPEKQLEIEMADIRELDELTRAIVELNEKGTSSAKLAEIIDMVNIPIGALEYSPNDNFVFCTQSAANILEFHNVDESSQYISKKFFEVEAEVLRKKLQSYEEDIYQMVSMTGSNKWIRIKIQQREEKTLIAVLDVTEEVLEKQKIAYERDYDILTRLLNRTAFRSRMGKLLKRGNLDTAAVVMIDLDNLKYFNDTYGHDYGDSYIKEAAAVLSTLNQYNSLVARMSGDEFLIFIYGYSNKDEIRKLVYEVHDRLKESYIKVPTGENIRLRASGGIAWYPDDATYLDELIKYADFAMYEIKGSKKGEIKEFDRDMYLKDSVLFTGKEELNRLLEEPDMVRYIFQPIVEVATGEVFGYEALMRPQIESLRSPEDVMRLAKAQSKLYQVERVTWMSAMKAVAQQSKPGDKHKIFINSVPNHVLDVADTELLEATYPNLLERVIIEIIESEQTDKSCMETKCEWAKKHGAKIALDDFGTGYSNESTLLYIDPNYVKLDMSIISNIHKDEGRQKIVQGLLTYTKSHGIKVIAEGIDCYEEMQTLIQLGVDYMQGWYLACGKYEMDDISEELKSKIRQCVSELK